MVNFQPLHALKIPESAFAFTCKQKRGSEGDMKNLFRAYVCGNCLRTDGKQRTLTFKQILK